MQFLYHDIKIAKLDLIQSEKDLAISESDLKPTASLSLERSFADDFTSTISQREKDILKATVSWPFYSWIKWPTNCCF